MVFCCGSPRRLIEISTFSSWVGEESCPSCAVNWQLIEKSPKFYSFQIFGEFYLLQLIHTHKHIGPFFWKWARKSCFEQAEKVWERLVQNEIKLSVTYHSPAGSLALNSLSVLIIRMRFFFFFREYTTIFLVNILPTSAHWRLHWRDIPMAEDIVFKCRRLESDFLGLNLCSSTTLGGLLKTFLSLPQHI